MTQLSHAQTINGRYLKSTSHFITLQQRLADALKASPIFVNMLTAMVDEYKRRHADWLQFADLKLCKAIMVPMDKILIDTTMQRSLNLRHVLNILQHFRSTMVMAIQVYEDENKPGYYIAWDGQHTDYDSSRCV